MTTTDLYRVESTMIAVSHGLGSEWATDHVAALGLSSIYNRLGGALLHLDCHRNATNQRLVIELLASDLVKLGICLGKDSVDLATDSLKWWLNKNCPYCQGAGKDFAQHQCPACDGTGERARQERLNRTLGVMNASLDWLEQQQRKRLANYAPTPQAASRHYDGLPNDCSPIQGWVTPKRMAQG